MEENKLGLTKEDFDVNEEEFGWILFYLDDKDITTREDALDYHSEPSEEAMFNWLHEDTENPIDIKNAPMPSELRQCAEINGTWYYWYQVCD